MDNTIALIIIVVIILLVFLTPYPKNAPARVGSKEPYTDTGITYTTEEIQSDIVPATVNVNVVDTDPVSYDDLYNYYYPISWPYYGGNYSDSYGYPGYYYRYRRGYRYPRRYRYSDNHRHYDHSHRSRYYSRYGHISHVGGGAHIGSRGYGGHGNGHFGGGGHGAGHSGRH